MKLEGSRSITVNVDGETVRKFYIAPETQDENLAAARAIYLPLSVGHHEVSVSCDDNSTGAFHATIEVRTYHHVDDPPSSWVAIEQQVMDPKQGSSSLRGSAPWTVPVRLTMRPNASDWRFPEASRSLMVEIPIPSSMEVSASSFRTLSRHPALRHVEVNSAGDCPVLGLFIESFTEPLTFDLDFVAQAPSDVVLGGARILPMYQPEHAVSVVGTRLRIE
eukprot:TRINITY_DN33573_c0_g1_i1.p1 TRINITY_DN33573_c0_g1~~TRINITY_DN33573_c0_g1_i1.p1  ORF type:complete len:236 (+),score=28.01 TRINITY_DN33573_c0_g1_i1:51-710(+)